ncbi:hypothetical protein VitviT2T_006199 [Vitis vinifera]|uniref:Myb/SANT-like domain-containing protein n=1 Tax=Vitis vinifera TaxID=29760 RepID=A0ABY9BV25_VITVI|nr:hypothetical protein VitviT2T_006199 [Vitis vinifera]
MSQNIEISRANWTDPIQRKHFIDLCLQEANKGFRSGGGLKSSAWPRIAEELEKLLGKRYTSKQLKNGWDYMKRQYLIWSKMMTMTGHGYNSVTKTFDWPAEKWEEYLQKYPEAKQFRFKPLANVEELEALFGGVLATRSKNWSSGGVIASGAEESSTHSTSMPSETSVSLEEDEDLPRNTNDETEGSKKKQKKGKKEQTQEEMYRIVNVLENFEGSTVKECMKILKRLLTYEDPLYYVAINAFCKKKEYRETYMFKFMNSSGVTESGGSEKVLLLMKSGVRLHTTAYVRSSFFNLDLVPMHAMLYWSCVPKETFSLQILSLWS